MSLSGASPGVFWQSVNCARVAGFAGGEGVYPGHECGERIGRVGGIPVGEGQPVEGGCGSVAEWL